MERKDLLAGVFYCFVALMIVPLSWLNIYVNGSSWLTIILAIGVTITSAIFLLGVIVYCVSDAQEYNQETIKGWLKHCWVR